ncbi:tigger transposable element-derived protein 1 [Trichonephila clavipes]|nr:tigger transposable element-derived protein 1 [Trichonephila clavipes]
MNISVCDTTGHTVAYLQFGRQLRTSDDIRHDIRQVIDNDNFVPEITPYLKRFANSILDVKDRVEQKQDCQKENFDRRRRRKYYKPGDKVWVTIHPISRNSRSRKFMPKTEDRLGKGEGSTAIGKHFNVGESTVRAIKKNEAAIGKSVISGTKLSTKFASYTRDVLLERTERAIAIWIEEQVQRRIPVSGYLIQEKALQFYKSMKQSEPLTSTSQAGKEFSASKGWLTGFLKRNALHNIKITEESATANEGAAKIFPEELAKIIEDGDYSADQVLDADETGLYWKKLPNRTYIAKDEKTASGHKANGVVGLEGDNDEEEKSTPLTGKLIQGLQLCCKLENHFLINDPNSERASKLQRRATQNENEVCENPWPLPQISIAERVSSDDEGDLEPLRKRCKPLSDSDNG